MDRYRNRGKIMADLNEFQSKIGYTFKNRHLLEQALTHSSYANEKHMKKHSDNERLEFLGDAVLEIVSSEFLFINYPQKPEGELTKLRASIVCEPTLALCTKPLDLGKYLRLGRGEDHTGGRKRKSILSDALEAVIGAIYLDGGELTKLRASIVCEPTLALCTKPLDLGKYLRLGRGEDHTGGRKRKSILSDALEAVIGAIYLDGGFTNAKEFVLRFIMTDIENKQLFYDSKTILQELIQGRHEQLSYELIDESGPDHDKQFTVAVLVDGERVSEGEGHTKKAAEQQAAYQALLLYRNRE
jgi:dsRNA-specific ribonuclease